VIDRAKYLERQRRYNQSKKGKARLERYDAANPQVRLGDGMRVRVSAPQTQEEQLDRDLEAYREWCAKASS
jgi:hypothetical protein